MKALDRKTPLAKVRHELFRVKGFIEDGIERLEHGEKIDRAKYYISWSHKIIGEIIEHLGEVEEELLRKESLHDAV